MYLNKAVGCDENAKTLRFTVFTPTFNRAHTLRRVYDSLCLQPHDIFEWLVVDDGSLDETPALLSELSRSAPFPVRVIRQANGGKHRAHNAAVMVARGELTVILDSDDELTASALTDLLTAWLGIAENDRGSIAGILGHSISPENRIVGSRYPAHSMCGRHFELAASGVMEGDKLPCYRSDVLRAFPFPERPGCKALVPEGTVWSKIGSRWNVLCLDRAVLICHRNADDPISLTNSHKRPDSNAWGRMQYCLVILNLSALYLPRFFIKFAKASVNCTRFSLHSRCGLLFPLTRLEGFCARSLWIFALPIGLAAWANDRVRLLGRNR